MWWQWILKFLTGSIIGKVVDAYKAKLAAGNVVDKLAADLAGRELEVQSREIQAQAQLRTAEIGHWSEPDHLMGYIMVLYLAKAIIWDNVLGYWTGGSTDPIRGQLGTWAGAIMMFYIGRRGAENISKILSWSWHR